MRHDLALIDQVVVCSRAMLDGGPGVFGTRTRILVAVHMLGETHAAELSRLLGASPDAVRNSLCTLKDAGLIVGAEVGRARVWALNPCFVAGAELRALLQTLGLADPLMLDALGKLRRRPRRSGKEL